MTDPDFAIVIQYVIKINYQGKWKVYRPWYYVIRKSGIASDRIYCTLNSNNNNNKHSFQKQIRFIIQI